MKTQFFFLLLTISSLSCAPMSAEKKNVLTYETSREPASIVATTQPIDYEIVGFIPKLKQTKSMGCWATVATMLYSWKKQQSFTVSDAMNSVGTKWGNLYNANTGLSAREKPQFVSDLGLTFQYPMSISISGWEQMLRYHGPIWVTTDEQPGEGWAIHARVVIGIKGDGTPANTFLKIIDPATGNLTQESIKDFVPKFEEEIRITGGLTRIQILHW